MEPAADDNSITDYENGKHDLITTGRCIHWLDGMVHFCEELQDFVLNEVPAHASDPLDYVKVPEAVMLKWHKYPHMLAACGWRQNAASSEPLCTYMTGIPCTEQQCRDLIELVQGLGAETYSLINKHPTFNKFRSSNVDLFFEAPLNMCMALGTEHGWLDLRSCRQKARDHVVKIHAGKNMKLAERQHHLAS